MKLQHFSLLILCGLSVGRVSASEQPERVNITDFIVETLRTNESTKWCRSFAGGTVCDPYFKEAVLDPRIYGSDNDGSYCAEIMDEKDVNQCGY